MNVGVLKMECLGRYPKMKPVTIGILLWITAFLFTLLIPFTLLGVMIVTIWFLMNGILIVLIGIWDEVKGGTKYENNK